MINTVLTGKSGFCWIDVVNPEREELDQIAQTYNLHATAVLDCLDPEHLPKYERFGDTSFIILRAFDETAPAEGETVQELTRKIAVFYGDKFFISIHRKDQPFLAQLREQHVLRARTREIRLSYVLTDLMNAVASSYEKPLDESENTISEFEAALFNRQQMSPSLQRIHVLKRRVSLIKRMLWLTIGVVHKMAPPFERNAPLFQDVEENVQSYHFYADELLEEVNNLLSIHLAMASHRTNEVMRVLTVFSAFFLPLTFIVGIYGMNFSFMPELTKRWGYPGVMLLMLGISLVIFIWFRRRGWLRRPPT
ncbi:MAG TPA: CorA family divalent cation transporter [Gemmatimonadales bacterium]|jgi:magnesium transporter|nr:CorA family divalent cation transporter [Gemmatimonadales bacterium]